MMRLFNENNQRNYLNNQFFKRKRNKSQGEHLQYLKIKLYKLVIF